MDWLWKVLDSDTFGYALFIGICIVAFVSGINTGMSWRRKSRC